MSATWSLRRAWMAVLLLGVGWSSSASAGGEGSFVSAVVELDQASAARPCEGGFVVAPGAVARFIVRATRRTMSCHCAETTTSGWGCGADRHCMSDYDYGGHNPTVCEPVGEEPVDVTGASPELISLSYPVVAGCTAAASPLPGRPTTYALDVSCPGAGSVDVSVAVGTASGPTTAGVAVKVTEGGACPAVK